MILLTDAAQDQIIKLSRENGKLGIRLKVLSGGCSGYVYRFSVAESVDKDNDVIVNTSCAVALFVDHAAAEKIDGCTIDYVKDIMSERFVVTNPNSACCGCGESFS